MGLLASRMWLRELQIEYSLAAGPQMPVLHLPHLLQPRPKDKLSATLRFKVFSSRMHTFVRKVQTCIDEIIPGLMMSRRGCMSRGLGNLLLVRPGQCRFDSVEYQLKWRKVWSMVEEKMIKLLIVQLTKRRKQRHFNTIQIEKHKDSLNAPLLLCVYNLMDNKEDDNWLPMESNPEVMTNFLKELGLNADTYIVQDLLSTEQWAQEMLGQPVLGLVFLYQINQLQKDFEKAEATSLEKNVVTDNVFFMKQYAKNACGTIALFHIVMNNIYDHPDLVKQASYFSKFAEESFGKTPAEIGEGFRLNKDLLQKHRESVKKGQTKVSSKVETHFIAFVEKDGFLYELDGRKKEPINHGECTPEGLTFMACLVIQKFMQRDPTNNKFTILALGKKPEF